MLEGANIAVLGRVLVSSAERLDLADFLAEASYSAGDFKYFMQGLVGKDTPYILTGFNVIDPQVAIGTTSCSIQVADSVVFYPGSAAGPFYVGLPAGNTSSLPLVPQLRQNAVNYVYLTFTTFNTAQDSRAFWDPDINGGVGGEFSQNVNTESVLGVQVNVSVGSFPANTVPVAAITVGATVITAIEDSRDLMFRLGTGGVNPDPFNTFNWPALPSSSYERNEPPTTMLAGGINPFEGGDKNINTLKQWMDAVMSKLRELGGTTYWYEDVSSINLVNLFLDAAGTVIQSTGLYIHSLTTPGLVSWTADIMIELLPDPRVYTLKADTDGIQLQNGQIAYINLIRQQPINSLNSPVSFTNGATSINTVGGVVGLFANLAIGDWILAQGDIDQNYAQVVQFWSGLNGSGSVTTAALAKSVTIVAPYLGATAQSSAVYDKGIYTSADVLIQDRTDALLANSGGNFFWIAFRSDNIQTIAGAYAHFNGVIPGTSTSVLLTANNPGLIGNNISLSFSGSNTITAAIATWNAANPSNQVSLTSGNGSQVPSFGATSVLDGLEGSIVATDLDITISTNTVTQALVTSTVASNLVAGQRVQISGTTDWNGIFQVLEVLTPTTFYITPPTGSTPVPESGVASYATVTTSDSNGFPNDATISMTGTTNYGGGPPTASGTLTLSAGSGDLTITFSSWIASGSTYTFTVTSANANAGAVYTNNNNALERFVVQNTITSGTTLVTTNIGTAYQIAVIDATHFQIPVPAGAVSPAPPGSPPLGTAATYGILGASAITNTGSTVINGNLGLYPGTSVTGFPPGTVTGTQNIANAAADQAQIDALAAYTYGNAQSATAISSTLDGQTLTPGVYKEASGTFNLAASGTGTLTLNGAGVYIFQCASTLTTGAGGVPIINLTNGALASNVYWIVGSSATINSGSIGTFQGTIIANASVTDTMGGTVNGRLIALTAAVTLSAATVVNTPISANSTPTEISGTAALAAVIVHTQLGPFTLYPGQSVPINGTFATSINSFINATPDYALPPGYNTLAGTVNFNGQPTDSISLRLSELTAMMADKAQDKTIKYLASGLRYITNTTSAGTGPVDLTGQDLGSVGPLAPGLYHFDTSAQLTGTLTLDAAGDPNAQWFFQIGSTLTTASSSIVTLINGAQAGNVFWQVGSSATIGTSTTFKGNLFASASITLNTSASVSGRLVALSGAITLDDNAVAIAPISPSIIATMMASVTTYGLLASSTITNTGGTVVIGDLGLSPGSSVTGFPPGTVSGTQNIANGAAATAQTDAHTVYTYIAGLTGSVGEFQQITFDAGSTLTLLQPGSPGNAVITLPSISPGISLGVNQSAYVVINRNAASTPSIVIANTSDVPITSPAGENIFVIAERLSDTSVYGWDGFNVAAGPAVPIPGYDATIESQDRNMKLVRGGDWSLTSGSSPVNFANYINASASLSFGSSGSPTTWYGQSFLTTSAGFAATAQVALSTAGGASGGFVELQIYTDSAGAPGTLLGTSNPINTSSLYNSTSPFPMVTFTFGTPIALANATEYHLVVNSSNISTGNLWVIGSSLNPYVDGNAESTTNSGGTWAAGSGYDFVFSVDGTASSGTNLAWSATANIQIPELADSANVLPAGNVNFTADGQVAYVEVNRTGPGGNLTPVVANIAAVPLDTNTVIIARFVGSNAIVGNNSMLLIPGESKSLYAGVSDQNLALIGSGVTEATALANYSTRGAVNRTISNSMGALDAIASIDAQFDDYFGMFRMIAKTAGNTNRVRITGSDRVVFTGETLTQSMSSLRVSFTGAEIDFATGSIYGGDATLPLSTDFTTPLGINFTPATITASQYLWYSVAAIPSSTNADNTINIQFNVLAGSASAATTVLANKPPLAGSTPLGYVAVHDNGTGGSGTITPMLQANIAQLGVGAGSGNGTGLLKVRLSDPISTTLPTGNPVTTDGVSVNAGDLVLFTNLSSNNNKVYKAVGTGTNITSWQAQFDFSGSTSPSSGDTVIVTAGTGFNGAIGEFNGTSWNFNNRVRYFNGADYWEISSLNSTALANNQVSPADIFSIAWLGSENMIIDYSIVRGTTKETGTVTLTTDGTTVSAATNNVDLTVSAGITFSADISGANLRLRYVSTNTGSAGQMKWTMKRWSDSAGGPGGIPSYTGGGGGSVTGTGAATQIALWTGTSNLSGNANFTYDTSTDSLQLGSGSNILQETILQSVSIPSGAQTNTLMFTYSTAYTFAVVEYSAVMGSNYRTGTLLITQDSATIVQVIDTYSEIGTTGLTFATPGVTDTISGASVQIRFNSTGVAGAGIFKYSMRRWG